MYRGGRQSRQVLTLHLLFRRIGGILVGAQLRDDDLSTAPTGQTRSCDCSTGCTHNFQQVINILSTTLKPFRRQGLRRTKGALCSKVADKGLVISPSTAGSAPVIHRLPTNGVRRVFSPRSGVRAGKRARLRARGRPGDSSVSLPARDGTVPCSHRGTAR